MGKHDLDKLTTQDEQVVISYLSARRKIRERVASWDWWQPEHLIYLDYSPEFKAKYTDMSPVERGIELAAFERASEELKWIRIENRCSGPNE